MFRRELERVFVLPAKLVMVAVMDDVNVVALANWFRFKMKSCGGLATAPRSLKPAISTHLEKVCQIRAVNLAQHEGFGEAHVLKQEQSHPERLLPNQQFNLADLV